MGEARLISFATDDALAAAVAEAWIKAVTKAQVEGRRFLVALSGGRVTRKFFIAAVDQSCQQGVGFGSVEFFWADERCVPPDDAESNFLLADGFLFTPGKVSATSIHRIEGEHDARIAADRATEELRRVSGQNPPKIPVLDLVLLGMGEDGHVASLFPGDAATESDNTSVFRAVANSPKPPSNRVTLGHGPIAAAREVWVLASGKGKEAALHESLSPDGRTPLARVIQRRPVTSVFSDINYP